MRSLIDMDTIQIEVTNACHLACANCTRFGHHTQPFFMKIESIKKAIDSMADYPRMTGIMGGEPLLHPGFEGICKYLQKKIPREKCGLWSCFPPGYEHYREIICATFKHVFLNDHTRKDIYHHPFLVGIQEVVRDKNQMWVDIDNCIFQRSWSASINPNGAFFCEMAAAFSLLLGTKGWKVEPGWWWRTPKDFTEQIEAHCPNCGGAALLKRRPSTDAVDDVSPLNLEILKGSVKIREGHYEAHSLQSVKWEEQGEMAAYKDMEYRNHIAERYGIWLSINDQFFWEPHLGKMPVRMFARLKERFGGE